MISCSVCPAACNRSRYYPGCNPLNPSVPHVVTRPYVPTPKEFAPQKLSAFENYASSFDSYTAYQQHLASGPVPFKSFDQRENYFKTRRLAIDGKIDLPAAPLNSQRLGFKIRYFSSGEMTGGCFIAGARAAGAIPPARVGELETSKFTKRASVKIRRAAECSPVTLKYFITLTFAPTANPIWCFNTDGTIRHDYAKYKLKKFLHTCSMAMYRKDEKQFTAIGRPLSEITRLQYIWVAELQKNGNIHFHILTNRFFPISWLTKVWAQAKNSVDVKSLENARHAVNYMRKYMTKDEQSTIKGNRYFITKELHDAMKPEEEIISSSTPEVSGLPWGEGNQIRDLLHDMKHEITSRGGVVLDFGFSCPPPRPSRFYRDKQGHCRKTGYVREDLTELVYQIVMSGKTPLPF